ncbi:MAG: aldo/keto reductase, partial [Planctomycetota bacterium]
MPDDSYTPATSRYDARPDGWFRRAGRSGLRLPSISLGCWHNFGAAGSDSRGTGDEQAMQANARSLLLSAFGCGVTHFDLANNYGPPPGRAEERVGQVLREDLANHRDELVISTKAGWDMWPGPYGNFGSRKHLLASLDQSLKRLGLDYVDVYYHHRPDLDTPLEESLGALDQAVRSGKAVYAAISNYPADLTRRAFDRSAQDFFATPILNQSNYSMLNRGIEESLVNTCGELGVGIITFSPLAQGLLTERYLEAIPPDSRAATGRTLKTSRITPELQAKLRKLHAIAREGGRTLAQMALRWVLRDDRIASTVIGASRPDQIVDNCRAFETA